MYKKSSGDSTTGTVDEIERYEKISKPAVRKLYDRTTIDSFVEVITKHCKHRGNDIKKLWIKTVTEIKIQQKIRTEGIIRNTIEPTDTSEDDGRQLYDKFIELIEIEIETSLAFGEYNETNPREKKPVDQTGPGKKDLIKTTGNGNKKGRKVSKGEMHKLITGQLPDNQGL